MEGGKEREGGGRKRENLERKNFDVDFWPLCGTQG